MKPARLLVSFILSLWTFAGTGSAWGDILHLKNGRRIQVEEWWETATEYVYLRFGGTVSIPKDFVSRVERSGEGNPPGQRPPSPHDGRTDQELPKWLDPIFSNPNPSPEARRLRREFRRMWEKARQRRDWDEAVHLYEEALRKNPGNLEAAVYRVASYLAAEKFLFALSAAEEALWHHAEDPSLLYMVGEIHYRQDRLPDALLFWEKALAQEDRPHLRAKVEKARRELATEGSYEEMAGVRFRLRFDGVGGSQALAREVLAHLDNRIGELSIRLDHFPPSTVSVILYPDQEFRDTTLSPQEVRGLYDGKIRVPVGGLTRASAGLRRVLDHELVHAILHSKTGGNCPVWLQEGLAQYLSGDSSLPFLRALAREFDETGDSGGWNPGISYAAALSCVEFLAAWNGFDSWLAILDRLGEKMGFEEALRESLRMGSRELFTQWGESLREAAVPSR